MSLQDKINSIPELFDKEGDVIYSGRNVIKRMVLSDEKGDEHVMIVKRFGRMKWLQRICYSTFFASKAKRAYEYAFSFLEKGIDTPKPIAYFEKKEGGLLKQCYLVTEECSLPDCRFICKNEENLLSTLNYFVPQLSAFIARMHSAGILHGDLNLSNILYERCGDDSIHFVVIDINRTRFVDNPSKKQCLKNMMRLTHDRKVSAMIVGEYAKQRGWNQQESINYVSGLLDAFERRNDIKHAIFGKTKR